MPTVTTQKQLLTKLRSCAVVLSPQGDLDSFNLFDWEALGFGTPVQIPHESGKELLKFFIYICEVTATAR